MVGTATPVKLDEGGRRLHQQGARRSLAGASRARAMRRAPSIRGALLPVRAWARRHTDRVAGRAGCAAGRRRDRRPAALDRHPSTTTSARAASRIWSRSREATWSSWPRCLASVALAAGVRPVPRAVLIASVCGAYVVFSGVQTSAVRAWVMACIAFVGPLLSRRADPTAGLSAAAALHAAALAADGVRSGVQAVGAGGRWSARCSVGCRERWVAEALPSRALRRSAGPTFDDACRVCGDAAADGGTFGMVSVVSPAREPARRSARGVLHRRSGSLRSASARSLPARAAAASGRRRAAGGRLLAGAPPRRAAPRGDSRRQASGSALACCADGGSRAAWAWLAPAFAPRRLGSPRSCARHAWRWLSAHRQRRGRREL